jgi:hypothetical protein
MEWRGVTTANVFVANFFFAAAFGKSLAHRMYQTHG